MSSVQMKAFGEENNRPDMVLHAVCVEQREKLNRLSDEFESLVQVFYFYQLPEELKMKIETVNLYFMTGHWEGNYPFPNDGIVAESDRLKEALKEARHSSTSSESASNRGRSRSPLRKEALSETARMALDIVCKHDADPRVEKQRATIVRLQQELAAKDAEIADLRIGKGAIGPILLENRTKALSNRMDDLVRADLLARTETVDQFITRMLSLARDVTGNLMWGR